MATQRNEDTMDSAFERIKDAMKAHAIELFERDGHIAPVIILGKWDYDASQFRFALLAPDGVTSGLSLEFVMAGRETAQRLKADMAFLTTTLIGIECDTPEEVHAIHAAACENCRDVVDTGDVAGNLPSISSDEIPANAQELMLVHAELGGSRYGCVIRVIREDEDHARVDREYEGFEWVEVNESQGNVRILSTNGGN